MVREDKIAKVEDIKNIFEKKGNIIFTDHSGLKAENTYQVRNRLAEIDAMIKIIKNTLALRAVSQIYEELDFSEVFKGPTSMVVCSGNMVSAAKLIRNFMKEFETFKIKAGLLEGKLYNAESIEKLASLPAKEVLLAQLLGLFKNPMAKLVTVLNGIPGNLVLVLESVRRQKEQAAG